MRFKEIDGALYLSPGFAIGRGERKFELFTRKYLKLFLGAAIVLLVWAWCDALTPPSYNRLSVADAWQRLYR